MKKCIRWVSLAAVVFAAAGVLWGCGSGAGREASATMAAQSPPAANTYAAKAAETMAATVSYTHLDVYKRQAVEGTGIYDRNH